MTDLTGIKKRFSVLSRLLDERSRRLVAGAESLALARGGISAVSRATGISRPVIRQGMAELKNPNTALVGRIRKPGGGRKRIVERDSAVVADLEKLLETKVFLSLFVKVRSGWADDQAMLKQLGYE